MLAEQGKDIIYLIHSQGLLTLLEIPYEPKPHSSPLCQLYLRKTVFLPFLFNVLR